MDWDRVRDWLENPILVKHVRSRLRRQSLVTSIVVVIILCVCILWADYQIPTFPTGSTFGVLLTLQTIILALMGAGRVGASISNARASGILDFHRVSPLTPTELTLGFFFGAPIREYLLFACTLPFFAIFLAKGVISLHGFTQLMIMLLATTWILHGVALLSGLLANVNLNSSTMGGMLLVVFLLGGPMVSGGIYARTMVENNNRLTWYGYSLPWLAVALLYGTGLLFFVFLATRRRMDSDRIHPFSKPQALAALATLAALALGGIWGHEQFDIAAMFFLYSMALIAILLVRMVTPDRAEYEKGLWRALKQGRKHLPAWHDLALNPVFLVIACGIVLASATVAWNGFNRARFDGRTVHLTAFPLAIATAVLTVAYFGLALQYFLLRFGARGKLYFGLFLFLVWLVPILAGTIVAMASPMEREQLGRGLLSLSPLIGVSMIAVDGGPVTPSDRSIIQAAAITPPLLFVFVFHALLIMARRGAHREVMISAAKTRETVADVPQLV